MQLFCILVHANICFCSHKLSRLIFWHLPRLLRSLHGNEISELPDGIFNDVASLSHLWVIFSYCFNLWDSDEIFTWTPHGKAHSGGQVEQPRSNTGLPVVFFSWLAHVLTPPSISPVVKATHRPLHCLIPPTASPKHILHGLWGSKFVYICLSFSAWCAGTESLHTLKNNTKVSLLFAILPPLVPRLSAINRAISGRAAEEGNRTENPKQRHFVKAAQESRLHEIGVGGWMEGQALISSHSQVAFM